MTKIVQSAGKNRRFHAQSGSVSSRISMFFACVFMAAVLFFAAAYVAGFTRNVFWGKMSAHSYSERYFNIVTHLHLKEGRAAFKKFLRSLTSASNTGP